MRDTLVPAFAETTREGGVAPSHTVSALDPSH
jgi:hypothetical protein